MFYQRLLTLCSEKGIRITSLVSELQISSGNLSKWKAGNNPKSDTLLKIADYFNVTTDYLLGRTDEKHPSSGGTASPELSPQDIALLDLFRRLNEEGQEKVLSYANDLTSSGNYIKSGQPLLGKKKA